MQLFASAWGVGLVGADRSKLERKKLCIIEKLLNYLKYIRVAKILASNSIFGGGGGKNFWGVQNHSGGVNKYSGGAHPPPPAPPRKSVPALTTKNFKFLAILILSTRVKFQVYL